MTSDQAVPPPAETADPLPEADAVDRILVGELAGPDAPRAAPRRVAVLDDVSGALTLEAVRRGAQEVRVSCDSLADERRVAARVGAAGAEVTWYEGVDADLFANVDLVLLRLPKALAALEETAAAAAAGADPDVRLLAGARVKHMTRGMNEVLQRHFSDVTASLGQQKSRVLRAASPRAGSAPHPRRVRHEDLDLTVCAAGGVFAGASVDAGTRLLVEQLERQAPPGDRVVDLGCGTGVLAVLAARRLPDATVLAVDDSAAACRSASATAAANGLGDRVEVRRGDLLSGVVDGSVDLVLCNPPFHRGTSRDSDVAFAMIAAAGRALAPGGQLWTVFNSHLPYLPVLRRQVGRTDVVVQDRSYLVTRSRRAAATG